MKRVCGDVRNWVTLQTEYAHRRDVLESRRWDCAKPISFKVENLNVAQSSKCVRSDSLNAIATEIDVLQSLVGVKRVDAEKRQLVVSKP